MRETDFIVTYSALSGFVNETTETRNRTPETVGYIYKYDYGYGKHQKNKKQKHIGRAENVSHSLVIGTGNTNHIIAVSFCEIKEIGIECFRMTNVIAAGFHLHGVGNLGTVGMISLHAPIHIARFINNIAFAVYDGES